MPSIRPLVGEQWKEHNQRIRRLQRMQAIAVALICVVSVALTFLLGRALLDSSNRQQVSATQLRDLMDMRAQMRATETEVWHARATDTPLPLNLFITTFGRFRTNVGRLAKAHAGGDAPNVVAARRRVQDAVTAVDSAVGKMLLSVGSNDVAVENALQLTEKPGAELAAGMDAWIEAATARGNDAVASSRSISRRFFWGTVALMSLLGLGGVLWWFASERARARLSDAIGESEERFRSLVQNSSDAVMVVDRAGVIQYAALSVRRLLGYTPDELIGRPLAELVAPEVTGPIAQVATVGVAALDTMEPIVWQARQKDGATRHLESIASNRLDDPHIEGVVLNSRDVTDRHEIEAKLAYRAFHDPLTELANRALFEDRVNHALALSSRGSRLLAVLLIDLDDFKTVNDSLGHAAGDALIIEMANRIGGSLRSVDTAARLGGDEFVVLIETPSSREEVETLAQRLVDVIRQPTTVEGRELVVQASVGIAFADGPEHTAQSLLRDADIAMYVAKERGRAGYVVFEPSMNQRASDRLGLVADLHRAIDRGEMSIAYQPVVHLEDRRICGVEALLRWTHATRGSIEPASFIHLAEETGQIQEIGRWVLMTAMTEIARLGVVETVDDFTLAINVSTRQLEREDFASAVAFAIEQSGFPPDRLVLEITESALMRDPETLLRQLELLKDLDITLAIDDFGTGYSSLAYLARLPIDLVKIDRSFVGGIGASDRDSRIAQMIMGIGSSLALRTIAEGVEQPKQRDALSEIGCEMAQGFLFGAAMPVDQLRGILRDGVAAGSLASAAG